MRDNSIDRCNNVQQHAISYNAYLQLISLNTIYSNVYSSSYVMILSYVTLVSIAQLQYNDTIIDGTDEVLHSV